VEALPRPTALRDITSEDTRVISSITVTLLIAGLVGLLVFVFLEMAFLAVVQLMRLVTLAFAHTLLVSFVLRIIRALILEKWGRHGLYRAGSETDASR
jgi:ABC-type siderophore export system fused ATPase/permease subunit